MRVELLFAIKACLKQISNLNASANMNTIVNRDDVSVDVDVDVNINAPFGNKTGHIISRKRKVHQVRVLRMYVREQLKKGKMPPGAFDDEFN